jgi:hypothetical protein
MADLVIMLIRSSVTHTLPEDPAMSTLPDLYVDHSGSAVRVHAESIVCAPADPAVSLDLQSIADAIAILECAYRVCWQDADFIRASITGAKYRLNKHAVALLRS